MPIVADAAVAVRGDLSHFKKDMKDAGDETEKLGTRMKNAMNPKKIFGALAAAGGLALGIKVIGDATNAAAEFGDTVSATGVIFDKEAIPAMEEWADAASSAFGASKQDALQAANMMAVFGKSAGLAGDDLIGFSQELTQLGGDLASMFGGRTEDAIAAVGSALRGEFEPIRRYGVLLDVATLQDAAFRAGIISTTTQALTPQQRVLAAHAAILEQTSDAQGDFSRTSTGMANVQRQVAAQLENVTIEIGQELMPVMLKLANWFLTDGIAAMRAFVDYLKTAGRNVGEFVDGVSDYVTTAQIRFGDLGATVERHANEAGRNVGEFKDLVIEGMTEMNLSLKEAEEYAGERLDGIPRAMTDSTQRALAVWKQADLGGEMAADGPAIEGAIAGPFEEGTDAAVDEMDNMYAEIADVIAKREGQLRTAGGNAVDAWLEPQITGYEIARVESDLAAEDLRENLASEDDNIRRDAEQRRLELTAELISLKNEQATQGDQIAQTAATKSLLTSQFMLDGLNSKDPQIRELFRAWRLSAETHLGTLGQSAYPWGYAIGDELARGMWDSKKLISDAAYALANTVSRKIRVESEPPDHTSPLYGITRWGGNIVKTIADGIYDSLGLGSGAAGALAGALVPGMSMPGMALAGAGVTPSGGITYQLVINGVPKSFNSEHAMLDALKDLSAFGEGRLS